MNELLLTPIRNDNSLPLAAGAAPAGVVRPSGIARDRRLVLVAMDVSPRRDERGIFRRRPRVDPEHRQAQTAASLRLLDPDMVVLHGVPDTAWAAALAKRLLPEMPSIAYRAGAGDNPVPGGGVVVLSRHRFVETRFVDLTPVSPPRGREPDPGLLITTQDAGDLGRLRLAVLETGAIPRRVGDEPKMSRSLRAQVREVIAAVLDPTCSDPTILIGTPPVWPTRERAAWSALLSAGMVDGLMAAAPPAQQGIYDPNTGGLPPRQRHHLFMRVGDFARMFIDRIESLEGDLPVSLDGGAWAHVPRHRPLRVVLTPRVT